VRSLLLVLSLAIASEAFAQDADAREAFAAAERAFEEHDYELALQLFRRAQELRPHDAVRFNVAVCLENLGRFREAAIEYELAADSDQLPDEARARAREQLARTRARLGTLVIFGAPASAAVNVGELTCTLPCTLALDPGEHTVVVQGARRVEERRTIARGETVQLEVDAAEPDAPPPPEAPPSRGWNSFGVLTGIGALAAATGIGGIIGFGVTTEDLGARYRMAPTQALFDEGTTMRDWTNASIGLASVGLVLIAIDLMILAAN
jgi:hypothetical protein